MKHPNLRYGNPVEFDYYTQGRTDKEIAKALFKTERTIRDWRTRRQKIPFWVTELLRLRHQAHTEMMRQMGFRTKNNLMQIVPARHNRPLTYEKGAEPLKALTRLGFNTHNDIVNR